MRSSLVIREAAFPLCSSIIHRDHRVMPELEEPWLKKSLRFSERPGDVSSFSSGETIKVQSHRRAGSLQTKRTKAQFWARLHDDGLGRSPAAKSYTRTARNDIRA